MFEIQHYYSYPKITSMNVEFHSELKFPAVTVCNLSWRNGSMMGNATQDDAFYGAISPINYLLPPVNWSDPFYLENKYFVNRSFSFFTAEAIPDSKGTLAQRQIMVGMVGQRRRWPIYVGPTLGQPGIAMRNVRLWLVWSDNGDVGQATLGECWPNVGLRWSFHVAI